MKGQERDGGRDRTATGGEVEKGQVKGRYRGLRREVKAIKKIWVILTSLHT